MKITALLVLNCNGVNSSSSSTSTEQNPIILANACDVIRQLIVFAGRTVAQRTSPGQRQSVQHQEYKVHSYNRNGLCVLGFMDDHYPARSAFSLLNKKATHPWKLDSWLCFQFSHRSSLLSVYSIMFSTRRLHFLDLLDVILFKCSIWL
ncbi:hypothetical protein MKW94_016944 [Papaver nudicaule]|uniref:Longin domain-containing protein n=1 Tax=Papaver nudicaule TaxID=74823 RepID=A0AA41SIG0_PAPNU|nr:hypothetical protein [Papaver nudicaule]